MKPLSRSEMFVVEAAEGWLMLGNPLEADREIENVGREFKFHPVVLAIRWQIYTALEWWGVAWVVADFLCELEPNYASFWICQANSLRHFRGSAEAKDLLLMVAGRFGGEPVIAYNLACYHCQLGDLVEACNWLLRAFNRDETAELKLKAVLDPDLDPLWENIAQTELLSLRGRVEAISEKPQTTVNSLV